MQRCHWCGNDPLYVDYHDKEWGVPNYNDASLFELLLLEGFQAGLSWITVLKKRQRYREVFQNFNPEFMANLTDNDLLELKNDAGIIRNTAKLNAARNNANIWLTMENRSDYLWSFVGGKPQINHFSVAADFPSSTEISDQMSRSLKKLGFSFVGTTICYAFMQASGMVMDHSTECFRYSELK